MAVSLAVFEITKEWRDLENWKVIEDGAV